MIADSLDAMRLAFACAWCELPLRDDDAGALTGRRCAACGSRTGSWAAREERSGTLAHAVAPDAAIPFTLARALRERSLRRLARRVVLMAPPGPVLDVGSDGVLLDELRAGGRVATGIGGSSRRADVQDVDITELGGRYAAIVFWQSLGRARAPRAALDHAAALLKPDGLLTIAQPTAIGLPGVCARLRRAEDDVAQRVRIPQRVLVERMRALGLEVLRADRVRAGAGLGGWPTTLLDGVVSVQARR